MKNKIIPIMASFTALILQISSFIMEYRGDYPQATYNLLFAFLLYWQAKNWWEEGKEEDKINEEEKSSQQQPPQQ